MSSSHDVLQHSRPVAIIKIWSSSAIADLSSMHKQQNSVAGGDIDDNGQSNGSATSLFQLILVSK